MANPNPPVNGNGNNGSHWYKWALIAKGLTVTNALVFIMFAVVILPSYVVYRMLNSPELIDRFMSNYNEQYAQNVGCTIRSAKSKGAAPIWAISTGFAFQGADRWVVSVIIDRAPKDEEVISYCETLKLIVDFMRDPDGVPPDFPGSDEPIIREYHRLKGATQ